MIEITRMVEPSPEQMKFIIEGMRNPMNSWDKSDSWVLPKEDGVEFDLGIIDKDLMNRLKNANSEERKYMRMMPLYLRITAPLYWWKEFDTYKVGTVANSCSTMHKITEKEFTLEDFSTEHLNADSIDILTQLKDRLNSFRDYYINYDSYANLPDKKDIWWQMIQLLPSSYNQTRNVMINYEVARNIIRQRKNHKLDEWRKFVAYLSENAEYAFLLD